MRNRISRKRRNIGLSLWIGLIFSLSLSGAIYSNALGADRLTQTDRSDASALALDGWNAADFFAQTDDSAQDDTSALIPYLRDKRADGSWRTRSGADHHFSQPRPPVRPEGRAASVASISSDDFNRANLDPARWTLSNPLGDGAIHLTNTGTANARLEMHLPAGPSHDPWNVNRALRVMQNVSDGDFQLVTTFLSSPVAQYQIQGLLVEQDQDNWLRIELQHDGAALRVFAAATLNGSTAPIGFMGVAAGSVPALRVTRTGNDWAVDYAPDGATFASVLSFSQALTVASVGPFAANHPGGAQAPAFTVLVDSFVATADPIVEDGAVPPDTWPPLIHAIDVAPSANSASIGWKTDEPATGMVEYGFTSAYGISQTLPSTQTGHVANLTGLTPGATYHYRIHAEDSGGLAIFSADGSFQVGEPSIEVWYGDRQSFGQLGIPQKWVNVLGTLSEPGKVASLSYSLNGGPPTALTIGADGQRLENHGDFIVDIDVDDLGAGENEVLLSATTFASGTITKTVIVDFQDNGTPWPLPYDADWGTLAAIEQAPSVAHVVDGKWRLENNAIRTDEPGYDRLIAIGDLLWSDYAVTVPVTIHSEPGNTDRGVGILLRWQGHTDLPAGSGECQQPKCGWQPLGSLAWYHNQQLELFSYDAAACATNECTAILGQPTFRALTVGKTYWFKAQVETSGNVGAYKFKVWDSSVQEPLTWDTEGEANAGALASGSLLLLAHRMDVSFGAVDVQPLNGSANNAPLAVDDDATVTIATAAVINVLENDSDADGSLVPSSVQVVTAPQHGTATVEPSSGTITYTHDGGGSLSDQFTYFVKDNAGASSNTATVQLTIDPAVDTTPPVLTLLGDSPLHLEVGTPFVDPGATAQDDKDGNLNAQIVIGGDVVNSQLLGVYNVTYDVADSAGNAAPQQTRTVHVQDTTAPLIVPAAPLTMTLESGMDYVEPGVTATDNYDSSVTVQRSGEPDSSSPPGLYTITYTATDSSGNHAVEVRRFVTVVDTAAPTITLLGDIPYLHDYGAVYEDPGATAVDNVDGDLSSAVVIDASAVNIMQLDRYKVDYTVSDSRGNEAHTERLVIVVDRIPPLIQLIGPDLVTIEQGETYVESAAMAADNVDGDISRFIVIRGDVDTQTPGEYVVTYDVSDSSGNHALQSRRTVQVVEVSKPAEHQVLLPYIVY